MIGEIMRVTALITNGSLQISNFTMEDTNLIGGTVVQSLATTTQTKIAIDGLLIQRAQFTGSSYLSCVRCDLLIKNSFLRYVIKIVVIAYLTMNL